MRKALKIAGLGLAIATCLALAACDRAPAPESTSGVKKATVHVNTDPNTGLTVEQRNVRDRLVEDNKPGAVKHLYIIAPESGQVLIYSTVRGKVTSSGKRLSPGTTNSSQAVQIGSERHYTNEVLSDDGTYGSSVEYIFWWDAQGRYHQHFFTGGQIIHVSNYPLTVNSVILNMELTTTPAQPAPMK